MEFGIIDLSVTDVTKKPKKVKSRKDRFPKDGGKPVKASVPGYAKIPWTKGTLTLVAQSPDGQIHYAKTIEEKKQFAWSNFNWILVCWPGAYSQDIFLVDDMDAFRRALGFRPRLESVVVDEDGDEWIDALFERKPSNPTNNVTFNTGGIMPSYNDYFGR